MCVIRIARAFCALFVGCAFSAPIFHPLFKWGLLRCYLVMPVINGLFEAAAKIRVELLPFSGQDSFLEVELGSPLFRSVFREAWIEGFTS